MVAYKLRGKTFHAYWNEGKKKKWLSLKTDDERIARRKTVELEDEIAERKKGFYGDLPWAAFCQEYMEWSQTNKVEKSCQTDQFTIARFNQHFSPKTVKELTTKMLEDYKTLRKSSLWRGKNIKESTINRELDTLKSMSAKALDWGYNKENQWKIVKKFMLDRSKPIHFIGKENIIRGAADDTYDLVLCDLGFYQGLRRGEMVNLKREDVFFEEGKLRVVSTMGRRTKTKRERWIPLHRKTAKDLKKLFEESKEEYVLGRNGEKSPFDYLTKRFGKILKWAGIKEGTLHKTRHTFGTRAAQRGDIKTVQELLGHAQLSTTEIYVHSGEDAKKAVVDSL